jgi:hypothetical protein
VIPAERGPTSTAAQQIHNPNQGWFSVARMGADDDDDDDEDLDSKGSAALHHTVVCCCQHNECIRQNGSKERSRQTMITSNPEIMGRLTRNPHSTKLVAYIFILAYLATLLLDALLEILGVIYRTLTKAKRNYRVLRRQRF